MKYGADERPLLVRHGDTRREPDGQLQFDNTIPGRPTTDHRRRPTGAGFAAFELGLPTERAKHHPQQIRVTTPPVTNAA